MNDAGCACIVLSSYIGLSMQHKSLPVAAQPIFCILARSLSSYDHEGIDQPLQYMCRSLIAELQLARHLSYALK